MPPRVGATTPAPPPPRATAARSRSPKQRPISEKAFPGKTPSARVRALTPPQSGTSSSHEAPSKAKARTVTPPPKKAPPHGARPPPSPKAMPIVTEGRGPKAGSVNRPAAIVPPPELRTLTQPFPKALFGSVLVLVFRFPDTTPTTSSRITALDSCPIDSPSSLIFRHRVSIRPRRRACNENFTKETDNDLFQVTAFLGIIQTISDHG